MIAYMIINDVPGHRLVFARLLLLGRLKYPKAKRVYGITKIPIQIIPTLSVL